MVRLGAWLLCAVAVGLLVGCQPDPHRGRPRLVVLYATCSLNKDFLAPYDSGRLTPALESFAAQSRVFHRHMTESGQSGIAFASLFSGSQVFEHGVFEHPSRLSPDLDLLTEVFAREGYEVHTWLHHGMAAEHLGYAQGVPLENLHEGRLDGRDPTVLSVLDRVRDDPEARVLMVTNFTLTHGPYRGFGLERLCAERPARCEITRHEDFERLRALYRKHHIALSFDFPATSEALGLDEVSVARLRELVELLYEASVLVLDEEFGEVVDAIDERGLAEAGVVAFTADHGEVLFRDNADFHWTHGFQLAPEVLNVPLLIRAPGLRPGSHDGVTRSIDVLPTLAGLAGLASPGSTSRGIDLSRALFGEEPEPELIAMSHTALFPKVWWLQWGKRATVRRLFPDRSVRWSAVALRDGDAFHELRHVGGLQWRRGAYDLAQDPAKRQNLFDPEDARHVEHGERLARYKEALVRAAALRRPGQAPIDEEKAAELLRSLGYIE